MHEFTFPGSVRAVSGGRFVDNWFLHSVVVNEGLEELGEDEYCNGLGKKVGGQSTFSNSMVKHVRLPSTLRLLGTATFANCS